LFNFKCIVELLYATLSAQWKLTYLKYKVATFCMNQASVNSIVAMSHRPLMDNF